MERRNVRRRRQLEAIMETNHFTVAQIREGHATYVRLLADAQGTAQALTVAETIVSSDATRSEYYQQCSNRASEAYLARKNWEEANPQLLAAIELARLVGWFASPGSSRRRSNDTSPKEQS